MLGSFAQNRRGLIAKLKYDNMTKSVGSGMIGVLATLVMIDLIEAAAL